MEHFLETDYQTPKYERIALDIAKKILNGNLSVGEKLRGRSTLAGIYHVSPETIRKAIAILERAGILQVMHGNGALIVSKEAAKRFLDQSHQEAKFRAAVSHFHRLLDEHKRIGEEMERVVKEISKFITD